MAFIRSSHHPTAGAEKAWKTLPLLLQAEGMIRLQFEGPPERNLRRAFAVSSLAASERKPIEMPTGSMDPMRATHLPQKPSEAVIDGWKTDSVPGETPGARCLGRGEIRW
jgi:hypothetical protein